MTTMKNVKFLVKLRRLVKSLAVTLFILSLGIISTAFSADVYNEEKPVSTKPSDQSKNGFKSLFSASSFDPTKPYVSQLNAKAVPFVQAYIKTRGAELEKMKVWGKPYLDIYDVILAKYGLPKELKYLSVIESQLLSNVVSIAGATGPWQIMASEAQRMGLKVGGGRSDERTNYTKSTHAAAKILKELYGQFNDWILVIAAYNCGQGRMRQAIRKSGSRNFWDLQAFLPLETRNHVKKFISTHYIFEGTGGLTTMTAAEVQNFKKVSAASQPEVDTKTSIVEVSGKYSSLVIARQLGMEIGDFNNLNPQFDQVLSKGNEYNLRLPKDKVQMFTNKKNAILSESVQTMINAGTAFSAGK